MRRYHPSRRDDDGVIALEFVFLLPFLLMLLIGGIVLGNYLSVKGQASNWAREGARQAALFPGKPFNGIPNNVTLSISAETGPCPEPRNPNEYVTVIATMSVNLRSIPLIPTVLPSTLEQKVTMRCGG